MHRKIETLVFALPPSDWHSEEIERIQAKKLGQDRFQLCTPPFFAEGFSKGDIVLTIQHKQYGFQVIRRVIIPSGHSTVLLALNHEANKVDVEHYRQKLQQLHCPYLEKEGELLTLDIPADQPIQPVFHLLERGELVGVWNFRVQHMVHAV